jgi:hypothetical protein
MDMRLNTWTCAEIDIGAHTVFLAEVSFVEPLVTPKYFHHSLEVQFGLRHTLISSLRSSSFLQVHFFVTSFFVTSFFFESPRYFRHPLEVYCPTRWHFLPRHLITWFFFESPSTSAIQ